MRSLFILAVLALLCTACGGGGGGGGDLPPDDLSVQIGEGGPDPLLAGDATQPGAPGGAPQGAVAWPTDMFGDNIVSRYGAVGDGVTDDTAAFQKAFTMDWNATEQRFVDRSTAVDHYFGRPKCIYLPPGTYRVRDTLRWIGCAVTLWGAGPGVSIIRLADNSPGFGDPAAPKAVIATPAGNHSFRQNIHGLTIQVGAGNPGAIALDYIANNSGAVTQVELLAAQGSGHSGLALTRAWPGPCLIRQVTVVGFEVGIRVGNSEYGPTFEDIVLRGQRGCALLNAGNPIVLRRLSAAGPLPAIRNTAAAGMISLLDSTIVGSGTGPAIDNEQGALFVRRLQTAGAERAIRSQGVDLSGTTVDEHVDGPVATLFPSTEVSLDLPVAEVPAAPATPPADWAVYEPRWYGDRQRLTEALAAGADTVVMGPSSHLFHVEDPDEVFAVPAGVRRIIGFHGVVNDNGTHGLRFAVDEASDEPLVIERFGYGVTVLHRANRPLVLAHGVYHYEDAPGAGDLHLLDVQVNELHFRQGQRIWARQLNTEGEALHLRNSGSTFWLMGVKTEGKGTVIATDGGGATELIGTLLYPHNATVSEAPAFMIDNARASFIYSLSHYHPADLNYNIQVHVRETRGTETRELLRSDPQWGGRHMHLFSADPAAGIDD